MRPSTTPNDGAFHTAVLYSYRFITSTFTCLAFPGVGLWGMMARSGMFVSPLRADILRAQGCAIKAEITGINICPEYCSVGKIKKLQTFLRRISQGILC